jgi:hypothetical protein
MTANPEPSGPPLQGEVYHLLTYGTGPDARSQTA